MLTETDARVSYFRLTIFSLKRGNTNSICCSWKMNARMAAILFYEAFERKGIINFSSHRIIIVYNTVASNSFQNELLSTWIGVSVKNEKLIIELWLLLLFSKLTSSPWWLYSLTFVSGCLFVVQCVKKRPKFLTPRYARIFFNPSWRIKTTLYKFYTVSN